MTKVFVIFTLLLYIGVRMGSCAGCVSGDLACTAPCTGNQTCCRDAFFPQKDAQVCISPGEKCCFSYTLEGLSKSACPGNTKCKLGAILPYECANDCCIESSLFIQDIVGCYTTLGTAYSQKVEASGMGEKFCRAFCKDSTYIAYNSFECYCGSDNTGSLSAGPSPTCSSSTDYQIYKLSSFGLDVNIQVQGIVVIVVPIVVGVLVIVIVLVILYKCCCLVRAKALLAAPSIKVRGKKGTDAEGGDVNLKIRGKKPKVKGGDSDDGERSYHDYDDADKNRRKKGDKNRKKKTHKEGESSGDDNDDNASNHKGINIKIKVPKPSIGGPGGNDSDDEGGKKGTKHKNESDEGSEKEKGEKERTDKSKKSKKTNEDEEENNGGGDINTDLNCCSVIYGVSRRLPCCICCAQRPCCLAYNVIIMLLFLVMAILYLVALTVPAMEYTITTIPGASITTISVNGGGFTVTKSSGSVTECPWNSPFSAQCPEIPGLSVAMSSWKGLLGASCALCFGIIIWMIYRIIKVQEWKEKKLLWCGINTVLTIIPLILTWVALIIILVTIATVNSNSFVLNPSPSICDFWSSQLNCSLTDNCFPIVTPGVGGLAGLIVLIVLSPLFTVVVLLSFLFVCVCPKSIGFEGGFKSGKDKDQKSNKNPPDEEGEKKKIDLNNNKKAKEPKEEPEEDEEPEEPKEESDEPEEDGSQPDTE